MTQTTSTNGQSEIAFRLTHVLFGRATVSDKCFFCSARCEGKLTSSSKWCRIKRKIKFIIVKTLDASPVIWFALVYIHTHIYTFYIYQQQIVIFYSPSACTEGGSITSSWFDLIWCCWWYTFLTCFSFICDPSLFGPPVSFLSS